MLLCLMSPLRSSVAHTGRAQRCLGPAPAAFAMPSCSLPGKAPYFSRGGGVVSQEPLPGRGSGMDLCQTSRFPLFLL